MESTFTPAQTGPAFPALYKSLDSGRILLVTSHKGALLMGTIVYQGSVQCTVGEYSDSWAASCFKRITGTVTITCE